MSRAITVKVATPKVIAALEAKLAKIKSDYANQAEYEAKFDKATEKWKKEVLAFALANVKTATNVRSNYRSWSDSVNIDFDVSTKGNDFPAQPERDFDIIHSHTYKELVEDISNALTILKMTDEETVNASTMKQIAKYL
jgi:hypothetical protein